MRATVTHDGVTYSGDLIADVPPDPDPDPDPQPAGTVGYFGIFSFPHCAVRGAHILDPNTPLWEPYYGATLADGYYDGGMEGAWVRGLERYNRSLAQLGDPTYVGWGDFDAALAANPDTAAIWWVLAYTDDEWRGDGGGPIGPNGEPPTVWPDPAKVEAKMTRVMAVLRERWAGPVFASTLPHYSNVGPTACKSIRDWQTDAVRVLLDRWIADGLVLRGPSFPTPQAVDKAQPLEVGGSSASRCTLNEHGILTMGAVLVAHDWLP